MPRPRRRAKLCFKTWITTAGVVCLAGCGAPDGPSPTPRVDAVLPIALTCPSDIRIDNVIGASRAVTYTAPTTTGGVPPIAVTCSTASGGSFPLGETIVTCQGTDGVHTAGQCHFTVGLTPATPTLRFTRFMAFGDSITAGEVNDDTGSCVAHDPFTTLGVPWGQTLSVQPNLAYPTELLRLLAARYTAQTPIVFNEGRGADTTTAGMDRFAAALTTDTPEVVLLLQGVVDIADHGFGAVQIVSRNLHTNIVAARNRGVSAIFLSTLAPTRASEGLFRGCYATDPEIRAVNAELRRLAIQDGVTLVDTYGALADRVSTLIGPDGLHPTAEGLQVVAQTFFAAIREQLETTSATTSRRR